MGFKQRERKRRQRKARILAKNVAKASHKMGGNSGRWWLTPVEQTTCCARHGGVLRPGKDMVYRHTPREALCLACADREGIAYRPSRRWEDAHRRPVKRRATWMREPVVVKRIEE